MAATMIQPVARRPRVAMLIASPDSQFRRRWLRESAGLAPLQEAEGGAHALAQLSQCDCERVILDKRMLDLDAVEVAGFIRQQYPSISVEMVDSRIASAKSQIAAPSVELGDGPKEICIDEKSRTVDPSMDDEERFEPLPGMIGRSPTMQEMYQLVRLVASRDTSVLLTGETGTGKELVAQAIHQLSGRAKHPFVAVNCAAIPEALLESELFGHVRGAFTGAVQSRLGRIHVAIGGTLFLDEIGDLPLGMQGKLLRFLQNGEVQRLGSSDVYRMDVRVVCATNVRLMEKVQAKEFRQDLYYRLAVFPVTLPPLRQRLTDLESLAEHFLDRLSRDAEVPLRKLSREALKTLMNRRWEGNVRELEHALERAFILSGSSEEIQAKHCVEFGGAESSLA